MEGQRWGIELGRLEHESSVGSVERKPEMREHEFQTEVRVLDSNQKNTML